MIEGENTYRLLFIDNPQPMWIYDLETLSFLEVNHAAEIKYGYTSDEFLQMTLKDIRPVEDIPALMKDVELTKNTYNPAGRWRHLKKNGDLIFVEITSHSTVFKGRNARFVVINDITELKQAEEIQKKSEAFYKSVLHASPDNITITDLEGNIVRTSPKSLVMFGFEHSDQLIGRNLIEFISGDDREKATAEIGRMHAGILTGPDDYTGVRSDGTTLDIEVNGEFIRDGNGNPTNMIFVVRDISDRKRIANEIIEKKNLLSNLIINLQEGILLEDSNRRIVLTNHLFCDMFGIPVPPESMVGADCSESAEQSKMFFKNPDDFIERIDSILKNQIPVFSDQLELVDGRYFERDYIPTFSSSMYSGHMWKYRDITDRRRTEKALNDSEIKYRSIVENINDVLYEIDETGIIKYISPAIKKILGYTANEIIGLNFGHFIGDKEGYLSERLDLLGVQNELENEYKVHNKSGQECWIRLSTKAIVKDGVFKGGSGTLTEITARKTAENELRKFRTISDQASYGNAIAELDGTLIYVNDSFAKMHGYNISEIQGKSLKGCHNEEQMPRVTALLDQMMVNGQFTAEEVGHVRKDGSVFSSLMSAAIVYDSDNNPMFLSSTTIDITEKKRAEEEIKQQNERLTAIVSAMPDLIFVIDKEGTYTEFYYSKPEQLPIPKDKIVGTNLKSFFSCEIAGEYLQQINLCITKRTLVTYEYQIPEGEDLKYYEARLTPYGDDKILSFVRDMTDTREKEAKLKKLSLAIEQSPVSIMMTDVESNIEYVNPAFETSTGYSFDEVKSKNPRILKSGKMDESIYRELWETIAAGSQWHGEWIDKKKNGEYFWENVSITPVFGEAGKVTGYIAVKQDITQRKQAEDEIWNLNATLERKIEDRIKELSEVNKDLVREIENRTRTEMELAIEKQRLASIIKGTNIGTWEWNIQTGETIFNERWAEMIGYTMEEIAPVSIETWMQFAHPDDLKKSEEVMGKHLNGDLDYYEFETRVKHKRGDWIWVFDRGSVHTWDKEGRPLMMSGTHQDITSRKRAADFDTELLQLSLRLTGIPTTEIPAALNFALNRIGHFLGADRAYIFEMDLQNNIMSNTFEWCYEGIPPEMDDLQGIPCDHFPKWLEKIQQHESVIIPSVQDLPESWRLERELLEKQGIKSVVAIPVLMESNLIGFVGMDSVTKSREYSEAEINILKVWSNMLASLINYRRKEELIEQTRRNYETFFNTIDDFLFVLDEQGKIIHTNRTVLDRLGYSNEELIDKSVLMVHPPARREEAGRIVGEMLAGTADFCPVPLVAKAGNTVQVETRVRPGFWNGKPVIFGVSKDVSKIKLSEEKFSKAFHSNSALMAISSFDGTTFLDVNETFTKTLGYTREELIGKPSLELDVFSNPELLNSILDKLQKNMPVRDIEVVAKTKSGSYVNGLFSADPIFIGDDPCLLTMMVDITERKRIEAEYEKARNEADTANLAKSEFISRMSHELRTPMNSILGFAQLLNMGELSQGHRKGVNHILNSGKHLLNLINEVLDISRIEAGRLSLTLETVQINSIILETMDVVHPEAVANGQTVELIKSPSNMLFVMADRQRLRQVLLNLVNNAIKYNRKGGLVTIKTELHSNSSANSVVRISITDTGLGIKQEDVKKLFRPFERIGADKTNIEGTGLGLVLAKELIEAMAGRIGVESIRGEGSTFSIELPFLADQENENAPERDLLNTGSKNMEKSGTILYIEDNLPNVELVESIIENHRPAIRMITTMYGKRAVKFATDCRPDLILLDLNLPDINGFEVLANLQSDAFTGTIPVVIISADATNEMIKKLITAGARDYLPKPIDIQVFLKIVDEWIDRDIG